MRLKWRRSRFSRRIMIHMVPHCAVYTGSITRGTSSTNEMAPDVWYSTRTSRTCSHGAGMASSSFMTACGTYLSAPRYTRLSCRNFLADMSPWSRTILRTCSGGMACFCTSLTPNLRLSP
jgi:hypothetical protein